MRRILISGLVVALIAGVAPLAAAQTDITAGGTFYDDDGNVHEGSIEAIAQRDVTLGCDPDGTIYCVTDSVTRGQMASFLVRAWELPASGDDQFPDDEGNVHEDNINALAAAGVTLGFKDGTFRPKAQVTRDQMASFLARAMGLDPIPGDVFSDVEGTHEPNINAIAAAGVTEGCNEDGTLFCPADPVRRDQMASFIARGREWPEVTPPEFQLSLQRQPGEFASPVYLTAPPGDARLFVVQQGGQIRIIEGGGVLSTAFLDVSEESFSSGGEQGLLGLAFHPDYADNGLLYVDYTDGNGDTVLYEYQVSSNPDQADEGSARLLLTVDQPYANHNGGGLAFGPDGYLYLGLGDGGSGGDPHGHGQNPETLLGSMLRIDVDGGTTYAIPPDNPFADGDGGAPEVWSYGWRNPWRWSFDAAEGLLYVGDVGQGSWEEVDVVDASAAGLNFGWNVMEGSHCYEPSSGCSTSGKVLPVVEYANTGGSAVIGGYVVRGGIAHLEAVYVYADLGGRVWSFRYWKGGALGHQEWTGQLGDLAPIYSFGQDSQGRVYLLAGDGVYRLQGN